MRLVDQKQKEEEENKANDSDEADGMVFPSQSLKRNLHTAYASEVNNDELKKKKKKLADFYESQAFVEDDQDVDTSSGDL